MTKKTALTILSANFNFYKSKNNTDKNPKNIVKFLLSKNRPKPTFIALQEVGNRLIDNNLKTDKGVTIEKIEEILNDKGYGVIRPLQDGKQPVNTRLFYLKESIETIKELQPIYNDYYCRQAGGLFTINSKRLAIFSLHFPLYGNAPVDKKEMWNHYIQLASSKQNELYDHLILAGDFNESIENITKNIKGTTLSHKIEEILKYMTDASDEEITYKETNTKLDHIFLSNHTEISNFETIENNFSDHKALLVNFFI